MAEYNVDIQVRAQTKQAERAVDQLVAKLKGIKNIDLVPKTGRGIAEAVVPKKALNQIDREIKTIVSRADTAAKRVARIFEGLGTAGVAAKGITDVNQYLADLSVRAGEVTDALSQLNPVVKGLTPGLAPAADAANLLSKTISTLEYRFSALAGPANVVRDILTNIGPGAGAAAGAVAILGAAINDQLNKELRSLEAEATVGLRKITDGTQEALKELIKFGDATNGTVRQYQRLVAAGKERLDNVRAESIEAKRAANTIVQAEKRLTAELDAQNDLMRQAKGLSQSRLQEAKAINSLLTKRRREDFAVAEAQRLNDEIAEYNRLAAEAAEATANWGRSLRAVERSGKAGVLGNTNQIRARIQEMRENRRSAEIARERSAAFMGTSGPMQGPGALGAVARAEANRVALRQQAVKLLDQERQKAQQNFQLMQNWTNVLRQGPEILADMQRLRAKELQDRKDAVVLAGRELSFEMRLAKVQERRANQQARKGQIGGAVQNALIGGAFPLLFGQTGAAAIGGGIGGAIGGLMGGQLGFGLSLLGTFLGDLIDKAKRLEQNVASLNSRLVNTGRNSITTAQDVQQLASALRMQNDEVVDLIAAFARFDDGDQREALAGIFAGIGDEATFTKLAQAGLNQKNALDAIFALRTQIGNEEARSLAITLTQNGALVTQQKLQELLVEESIKAKVAAASQINEWDSIRGAIAQSIVLVAEFVRFAQNFNLPGMEFIGPKVDTSTLDSLINKYKGMDAQFFASQRGKQVEADLRARVKSILDALKEETDLLALQGGLQDKLNGKIDNTLGNLQIQLTLKEKLRELSIRQADAARDGNTILMDALAMDAVLLQREAAIKTARLDSKNAAEEELRIRLATADADQKLADILFNRKQIDADLEKKAGTTMSGLRDQLALQQAKLEGKGDEVALEQKAAALAAENKFLNEEAVLTVLKQIDAAKELVSEQERMKQVFADIGMTIKDGIVDAISAAVDGTKSLAEVASNMLNNIANKLLDVAVNMALFGVPMGVGKGGLFGGFFADGGRPPVGKASIVGERGPELFVPRTSGTIVPNNALGGGTANIVVNVDASGSSAEGNANGQKQLGEAIGIAIRQELIKQKRPGGLLA